MQPLDSVRIRKVLLWRPAVALVLAVLLGAALPAPVQAVWGEPADLPGLESGAEIAKFAIIAGAVAGAAILYFRFRHKNRQEIGLSSAKLKFGPAPIRASSSQNVTITNRSSVPATLQSVEATGESFAITGKPQLSLSLKPGETATIAVSFTPAADERYKGKVRINVLVGSKSGSRSLTVSLDGRGQPSAAVADSAISGKARDGVALR